MGASMLYGLIRAMTLATCYPSYSTLTALMVELAGLLTLL